MIDQPYEIADAHTHIFPQKLAEKAAHSIADFYKVNAGDVGTVDILLENGRRLGISHYLVCSVATTPKQVPSINHFIPKTAAFIRNLSVRYHPPWHDRNGNDNRGGSNQGKRVARRKTAPGYPGFSAGRSAHVRSLPHV